MILTIRDFRDRVETRIDELVAQLKEITGRDSPEEEAAWRHSLPQVSRMLSHRSLESLHMYFGGRGQLSLEYPLPASASWCDLVLLGAHSGRNVAVMVELKDWATAQDRPGRVEGLVERHTGTTLHPSEQVRGYTEYCRRFHSTVQEYHADVFGCVLFTRDSCIEPYTSGPNQGLTHHFPVFTVADQDITQRIPAYFSERLSAADEIFAGSFERGYYRQDRNFCRQLGEQILDPASSPFVLLDNQRLAFARCKQAVEEALFHRDPPQKTVLVIQGPPGSGKSVIAAHLWAWLVKDTRIRPGNIVVTTTSASQRSNWEHSFRRLRQGGQGAIMPANRYAPVNTTELGRAMKANPEQDWDPANWTHNLDVLRNWRGNLRVPDNQYLVSIVDEAHALINPEAKIARTPAGWPVQCGPQAYHIMKASVLSVFLLDAEQGFRDRENTTVADLKLWAAGMGIVTPDSVVLEDTQFRCAGSKEYVQWVDAVFAAKPTPRAEIWRKRFDVLSIGVVASPEQLVAESPEFLSGGRRNGPFAFEIVDSPVELETVLRAHIAEGHSCRLAASFSREWKTKENPRPHALPPEGQDFYFEFGPPDRRQVWSRVWNFVPPNTQDYSWFIQAAPGSPMADDTLCEVGCPYVIRGFDYDFLGLLWQRDLIWRGDHWELDLAAITEWGLSQSLSSARRAKSRHDPRYQHLLHKIEQAYRILLTRAIRGMYVWCEDAESGEHLKQLINFGAPT
jgi:ABC-type dipeptide/oligopeptide/nickel transport system ATPase component